MGGSLDPPVHDPQPIKHPKPYTIQKNIILKLNIWKLQYYTIVYITYI